MVVGKQATIHNRWTEITGPQFCAKALVYACDVSVIEWSVTNRKPSHCWSSDRFVMPAAEARVRPSSPLGERDTGGTLRRRRWTGSLPCDSRKTARSSEQAARGGPAPTDRGTKF
jgi:hypothetical protein